MHSIVPMHQAVSQGDAYRGFQLLENSLGSKDAEIQKAVAQTARLVEENKKLKKELVGSRKLYKFLWNCMKTVRSYCLCLEKNKPFL